VTEQQLTETGDRATADREQQLTETNRSTYVTYTFFTAITSITLFFMGLVRRKAQELDGTRAYALRRRRTRQYAF